MTQVAIHTTQMERKYDTFTNSKVTLTSHKDEREMMKNHFKSNTET